MAACRCFSPRFFLGCILLSIVVFGGKDDAFGKIEGASQKCLECHEQVYSTSLNKIYIHRPFIDRQCRVCHIDDPDVAMQEDESNALDSLKLKWIRKSNKSEKNHWFLFSSSEVGNFLYLKSQNSVSKKAFQEIQLPPLEELREYQDNQSALKISNLEFVEVQRGIFISAKIHWRTNRISTSQIHYGFKNNEKKSFRDDYLSSFHEVELHNLKKNQTYELFIVASDPYGNEMYSNTLVFSTLTEDLKLTSRKMEPFHKASPDFRWNYKFFRCNDKYLLNLSSNKSAAVSVGIALHQNTKHNLVADMAQEYRQPPDHENITSRINTNNSVCFPCHVKKNSTYSHPVNVYPKPGMVIPDEYPTLPDGRITCMSCHASHASDHEYRLVKSSKRDLCIGCHNDR